jgi:hypothetical protein
MAARKKAVQGTVSNEPSEVVPIDIDLLEFDPSNPRIVELLGPEATQQQVKDALLGTMEARNLVPSFMANGFLPYEPLVVRPPKAGKHVVLEGNRRLAALLSMQSSSAKEERDTFINKGLGRVPCITFRGNEMQELSYLGLRHLSKTKDWGAPAKAAFVERILRSGCSLRDAARLTNSSTPDLRLLMLTRRLFERADSLGLEIPSPVGGAEGETSFWHLGDAVRRTRTKTYLCIAENDDPLEPPDVDESRLEKLVGWIYGNPKTRQQRLVRTIRDIPSLDECLGHPKSIEALDNGYSIEEALEAAQEAGATVVAHLDRAKKSVQRATGSLSDVEPSATESIHSARESLREALAAFDRALTKPAGK